MVCKPVWSGQFVSAARGRQSDVRRMKRLACVSVCVVLISTRGQESRTVAGVDGWIYFRRLGLPVVLSRRYYGRHQYPFPIPATILVVRAFFFVCYMKM